MNGVAGLNGSAETDKEQPEREGAVAEFEDLEPQKQKPKPRDLSSWGVDELNDYIASLEAEIERVKTVIAGKRGHRSEADALFKK
jgi:uncharacterized small protein (DUF1192 family)